MEKMFELATRSKLRFPYKGMVSVEDLWDIPLTGLDSIYKTLNTELKKVSEESLLETKTAADKELEVKIEIIKHIVKTKQEENAAKLKEKANKEQRAKIQEIIARKQDQNLENMSVEDLEKMLEETKQ